MNKISLKLKILILIPLAFLGFVLNYAVVLAEYVTNGGGSLTAGSIQTIPNGYGLVTIGFGSDDTRCFIYIKTAPVVDGVIRVDQTSYWRSSACPIGGGDDVPSRVVEPVYGDIAVGWSWGANTSGGHGDDDTFPAEECYYQEYAPLSNLSNKSGWGAAYDGTCNERGYSPGWLRWEFSAPAGSVITGVGLSLANDADVDIVAMNTRDSNTGIISASPNPVQVCPPDTHGTVTLSGAASIDWEIVIQDTGTVFAQGPPGTFSVPTGNWVPDGMTFVLRNRVTKVTLADIYGNPAIVTVYHTTEGCPVPTADIKCNNQDSCTIPFDSSATISWTSSNADSCNVSPTGWTGTSGSELTGNLKDSVTYTVTCTNALGSASDSVTVTVNAISCSYTGSTGDFCVGDSGSWTIASNPTGYNIDNRGTRNGVTDDGDGGIIGQTNLTYNFTFVNGQAGSYQRWAEIEDSSGNVLCTTNTINFNVYESLSASVNCPSSATAGSDFVCSLSVTGGKTPYSCDWLVPGDCTVSSGSCSSATISCSNTGNKTISVNVSDNGVCGSVSTSDVISISPENNPATADCWPNSTSTQVGQSVTINGTAGGDSPLVCSWSTSGDSSPSSGTNCSSFTTSYSSDGTKTVTFTVTDANNDTAVDTCIVNVSPLPDINVSMLPDSRTIYQGDNTNFGVTISSVNNFSGNVNLTLSGCPPGATCSLPSSTFVPAGSYSTVGLTITNTSSAPTGGFALTVTGTSGSISDSDTSWLNINPPPNSSPSVTSVDITEPDYCITGPSITVNWNYSDPEGDPQTYYQVQVDDIGSAWNLPLAYDSGKTAGSTNSIYATGLDFNVTYKARVKVWDSNNNESSWTESSSWKTPIHPYPDIQFNPPPPEDQTVKVEIPFDDQTVFCEDFTPPSTCFPSNANKTWVWDWDDSTQTTITGKVPPGGDTIHTYNSTTDCSPSGALIVHLQEPAISP